MLKRKKKNPALLQSQKAKVLVEEEVVEVVVGFLLSITCRRVPPPSLGR